MTASPPARRKSFRLPARAASLLLLALALGACGDGGDGAATTEPVNEPGGSEVVMKLIAFSPEELEVEAGTTVTWRQEDAGFHTVTSGTVEQGSSGVTPKPDGKFDSGEVASGDSYEFTFAEPGTYPYFCAIHPATMRGQVSVA